MRRSIFRGVLLLAAAAGISAFMWGRVRPIPHKAGARATPGQELLRARELPWDGSKRPAATGADRTRRSPGQVRVTPHPAVGETAAAPGAIVMARRDAPSGQQASTSSGSSRRTAARRPVPRDSFLAYRADTVEALARQAETDPKVRARYARHFGIPANQVAAYIRQNLVVSYLPRSGRYSMYYVTPGGRIYHRQVTLAQGTRVLTLRNGEPVMRWICGNAMVPRLPTVAVHEVREVPPPPARFPTPFVSVPGELVAVAPVPVSVPLETVTTRAIPGPPLVPPAPVTVALVPTPVSVTPAIVPAVVPPVTPPVTPIIPIIPPIIPVSPVTPPGPPVPPIVPVNELPPPEVPIPEPNGLMMLAMAAAPVAWNLLRARKRSAAA